MITVLSVNYNTPEYLERLLSSFRRFYDTPFVVVDGSDKPNYEKIKDFDKKYDIKLHHFDYNIHHGPGMALGITKLITTERILLSDSDIIVHNGGWLEMMEEELRPDSYGIGDIQQEYYLVYKRVGIPPQVRRGARLMRNKVQSEQVWIPYLHPVLALINREVALKYPMPIKGGAPLIEAMKAIHLQKADILQRAEWLTDDLWNHKKKYVQHNDTHEGMGTVKKTGGYHL